MSVFPYFALSFAECIILQACTIKRLKLPCVNFFLFGMAMNENQSVQEEKKTLRRLMRYRRGQMGEHAFLTLSGSIEKNCAALPEVGSAHTIHIYVSAINNEVHTRALIDALLGLGKRVVVPRCVSERRLRHFHINSLDELRPSLFGLLEPEHIPQKEVKPADLDLIIAPLLAFDRSGGRLGFGGGYYDDLFNQCSCPKASLAYSFQETERVPFESHDRRLDIIVTEKEIIRVR